MYKLRCNCGQNELFFKRLSASDFPNGFEDECCKQKAKQESIPADFSEKIAQAIEERAEKRRGRPRKATT
jgi:hypothetical protein